MLNMRVMFKLSSGHSYKLKVTYVIFLSERLMFFICLLERSILHGYFNQYQMVVGFTSMISF